MAKKSSEVIAEPTALAERMGASTVLIRYGEIAVTLKPGGLTYIQRVFCDSVRAQGHMLETYGSDDRDRWAIIYAPEANALYAQWLLRLGIESVEGIAWDTERTRISGRDYQCVKLECLDNLPGAVLEAAQSQIERLTSLSHGERERLGFTSQSQEETIASATVSSV